MSSRSPGRLTGSTSLSRARAQLSRLRKTALTPRRTILVATLVVANLVFLYILAGSAATSLTPYPSYRAIASTRAVTSWAGVQPYNLTAQQRDVVNVTRTLYRAYLTTCLGKDELVPATGSCEDWFSVGLTLIDSLDTLLLMGLIDEYRQSRAWAATQLSFAKVRQDVSMFEITIRALAGLNSAFALTEDRLWLRHAVDLADGLLLSFNSTETGCPPPSVPIGDRARGMVPSRADFGVSNPAEAGTLQLEFRTLSEMTGDGRYREAADKCMSSLLRGLATEPLATDVFNLTSGEFMGKRVALGARVDSFYEMQVKGWVGFGKQDEDLRAAYEGAVEAVFAQLVKKDHDHYYVGEFYRGVPQSFRHEMEHLTCFFPGTLAYGALHGLGRGVGGQGEADYMPRARELTRSCYAMSRGMFHGMAGEVTDFSKAVPLPPHGLDVNMLRPEIVEALYYMDKVDPDEGGVYKEWGEVMWNGLREYAQVHGKQEGILSTTSNLRAIQKKGLRHDGKLHSFAIAETFKYFFLLFDERAPADGPFPLTEWVYNTEAHPVRIAHSKAA